MGLDIKKDVNQKDDIALDIEIIDKDDLNDEPDKTKPLKLVEQKKAEIKKQNKSLFERIKSSFKSRSKNKNDKSK